MVKETGAEKRTTWSRRINLVLTIVWLVMVPVAIITGWIESIVFIAAASIYANAASHLAAWRSDENPDAERMARLEEKLDRLLEERGDSG